MPDNIFQSQYPPQFSDLVIFSFLQQMKLLYNLYKHITAMSKKGSKDKKGQNNNALQELIDQQKRQILQHTFTIRQLQDKISRMTEQNHNIITTRDKFQKDYEEKIDQQRIILENHQSTIERLEKKNTSLETMKLQLQGIIRTQEKQLQFSEEARTREMEEYKKLVSAEMGVLESQLKQYNSYMKQRDNLYSERNKLRHDLDNQKQVKIRELADKERQKVQQTDQLKDQMLMKIRDMKTNLLSLRKQQLTTTTRLAVLQNHQLTGQLQYQSKQTEKLLFQNQSLQKKLANMQKDVQIHKQVEQQLAKRSHVSKGIIKKLTAKIAELEEQVKKYREDEKQQSEVKSNQKSETEDLIKQQEMIGILDKTIQEKDRKILKLQSQYQVLESQNKNMKAKIKQTEKRSMELSTMLIKYYEQVLDGKSEVKVNENEKDEFLLDIRVLKKKPVKDWDAQQSKIIISLLLNQLKNNITKQNINIPIINKSQILLLNDSQIHESKLPNIGISEHSLVRKDSKKFKQIPTSLVPKLVGSNLRQWGRTVHSNSVSNLGKKIK